jgi:asparagine synthase (glutamine-hydrolysing)
MQSQTRAENAGWDLSYRPWANGRAMRIAVLNRLDGGEHALDANAQGLEVRDPTSDLRLLEFCLAVPDSQYLRQGQTRWLLHRLMGQVLPAEILQAKTKGLQAADWHEAVGADVPRMRAELQRLKAHGGVANYLDLDALLQALDNWPQTGWASAAVIERYRLKLLRGLAVGTFIRHVDPRNT